jgi:hypothetical protein
MLRDRGATFEVDADGPAATIEKLAGDPNESQRLSNAAVWAQGFSLEGLRNSLQQLLSRSWDIELRNPQPPPASAHCVAHERCHCYQRLVRSPATYPIRALQVIDALDMGDKTSVGEPGEQRPGPQVVSLLYARGTLAAVSSHVTRVCLEGRRFIRRSSCRICARQRHSCFDAHGSSILPGYICQHMQTGLKNQYGRAS